MLQAIQAVLRPFTNHWLRVKVLASKDTNDDNEKDKNIEDAAVEYEWTCIGFAASGGASEFDNILCIQCTIPASSGLFGWYRSIYGNENGKPLDEPAVFYSSPAADAAAEHMNAPPPPLDKRRNILIEQIAKDAVFGERVKSVRRCIGAYPIGIGKTYDESGDRELLDVHFKAECCIF
ncbi:hypothetical protein BGX30_006274 [Mortierella sp. GBA39]|nr:hypothetical protein BGX30_006274 [Mortierella sp. GBA39]